MTIIHVTDLLMDVIMCSLEDSPDFKPTDFHKKSPRKWMPVTLPIAISFSLSER